MADVVKEEPVDFDSNWTEDATQIDSSKCDKLPPNEHNNSDEEDVKKDSKFYQVCLTEHWNAGEGTSKQNDGLASTSSTKVKEEKDSENSEMEEDESKSLFEEELHNVEQSMTVEEGDERLWSGNDIKLVTNSGNNGSIVEKFNSTLETRIENCNYCDFTTKTVEDLNFHLSVVHHTSTSENWNKKRNAAQNRLKFAKKYKCFYCNYTAENIPIIQKHIANVHLKVEFKCSNCDYKTKIEANLTKHIQNAHTSTKYVCEHCDFSTIFISHIEKHIETVHPNEKDDKLSTNCRFETVVSRPKKCNYCSFTTLNQSNLDEHMNSVHSEMKSHKCEHCDFAAFTSLEFWEHVRKFHFNVKTENDDMEEIETAQKKIKYECEQCEFTTRDELSLKTHIDNFHLLEKSYKCVHCEYVAGNIPNVQEHIAQVHKEEFICSKCDFKTYIKEDQNENFHNSYRKLQCGSCGFSTCFIPHIRRRSRIVHPQKKSKYDFKTAVKEDLAKHQDNVHNTPRKFQCEHCIYSTNFFAQIRRHYRMFHPKKEFKCTKCDFKADAEKDLKKHEQNVHNTSKKFQCEHCDFFTRYVTHIRRHYRIVHPTAAPLKTCDYCAFTTLNQSHLEDHMKSVHMKMKVHKCEHCEFAAFTSLELLQHFKKVHMNIKDCIDIKLNKDIETLQKKKIGNVQNTSEKFKCVYCDFTAPFSFIILRHVNVVHSDRKSHQDSRKKFNYCSFSTLDQSNLEDHLNSVHLKVKGHKCEQCDFVAFTLMELQKHIKCVHMDTKESCDVKLNKETETVHKEIKREPEELTDDVQNTETEIECEFCDFTAPFTTNIRKHVKLTHPEINSYRICNYCPFSTFNKSQLDDHVNSVHLKVKGHMCKQCDFAAFTSMELWEHVKTCHLNMKGTKYCPSSTFNKSKLDDHVNSVNLKVKGHKCEQCDFAALTSMELWEHVKNCHLNMKGSSAIKLNKEIETDHKETVKNTVEEVKCEFCDFTSSRAHIRKHVKSAHPHRAPCAGCNFCSKR